MNALAPVLLAMSAMGVLMGLHQALTSRSQTGQAMGLGLALCQLFFVGYWIGRVIQ